MAPPRKGGAASAEQAKEKLTALVMADSFNLRFRPCSAEHPKVLHPLVNVPMLDYTLEWLAINQVEEVFVFCCAHADAIQEHLDAGGWTKSRRMTIHKIVSTDCLSLGDALRLMDHKDAIKTDFVLISGDVITNMKLSTVMDAHRRRRSADKSAIMTLVMRGGMNPVHRVRLGANGVTTVIDPATSRLLKYEEHPSFGMAPPRRRGLRLDAALFSERDDLSIRSDLVDTGVYICAPEVLMLFSDNFDYQNVRKDFVSGVLSEEELGNKIFVHEVVKEYIARVHSMRSYDAVSRDVMARWTYPLVPDTNLFGADARRKSNAATAAAAAGGGEAPAEMGLPTTPFASAVTSRPEAGSKGKRTNYRYEQGLVYLDENVTIERSAKVANGTTIGSGTYVGDDVVLEQTVIGRNCHIGAGAILRGCYLGDGVIIEAGVVATSAMLCDGVVVKEGAHVEPNVVLSYRVVVDRRAVVPAGARVSLIRPPSGTGAEENSDDEMEIPQNTSYSPSHRGGGGGGFTSSFSDDSDEDGSEFDCSDGPDAAVLQAAAALAADGIPETTIDFSTDVVGAMGAGFAWPPSASESTPESAALFSLEPPLAAMRNAADPAVMLAGVDDEEDRALAEEMSTESVSGGVSGGRDADISAAEAAAANEPHFKREVAETFLRCVKENISHENVVIELNGLKIAEDKTFADCARYMLTTALGLCLSPPLAVAKEYRGLYNVSEIDVSSKEGKIELLKRAAAQLRRWTDLLHKFLRNEEDQVELLLTLEEFCGEEGDFEGTGEHGIAFAGIFPQMLKLLYELDIAGEEAIMAWAEEKTHASDEEKEFLRLAQPFLDWLDEAEEESSDGDDESDTTEDDDDDDE